jgi:hypothetical protein
MQVRPLAAALLGVLLCLAAVACGGGGPGTDVPATTATTDTAPSTEPEDTTPTRGPSGALDYYGVGPVQQGMDARQVAELFGEPVRSRKVPGCELDPASKDQLVESWRLDEGALDMNFDAAGKEMTGYSTDSPDLSTVQGVGVGDSYDDLSKAVGPALEPLNLGAESTADVGFWYVERSPRSRLTFEVSDGSVVRVLGGYTPACE